MDIGVASASSKDSTIAEYHSGISFISDDITMRAKAGDMLNITLTANKPISHAEGTIMGRMADTIIQNDTVHTTIIIKQKDVNGNATFSIIIYDDFSNFTSNETTLDSANHN